MAAYTLRIRFNTTVEPDSPEMQRLVKAVQKANQSLGDGFKMLAAYQNDVLTKELGGLMIDDLAQPSTLTLEYEGDFHKVKRKR